MKQYFTKIYLLFWKNLVILKRQYIVTTCEILLPTLFAIALAYIRSKIPNYEHGGNTPTFFDEYSETDLVNQLSYKLSSSCNRGDTTIVGYVPDNGVTRNFVSKMVDDAFRIHNPCFEKPNVTFTGFKSDGEMEAFQSSMWLENDMGYGYPWDPRENRTTFALGIVFEKLTATTGTYKIRIPGYFYDTKDLMPIDFTSGPGYGDDYKWSSFSGIQLLLDKILIQHFTGKEPQYKISTQAFPYPEYKSFDIADLYNIFLPIFIITGFVFVVPTVVRGVVCEKETGIKELMKMSGLPEWMHWFGWMLNSLLVLIIGVTIITVVLFVPFNSEVGAVFQHSDPTLFWVILMVYAVWATTYCFTVSAFFERPTLATTAGIVIWLISFYGLGLAMEEGYGDNFSLGLKLIFCLFPNVGMHLTLKAYCSFEAAEKGSKWGNMGDTLTAANPMTLLYPFLMMFASMLLNMIICLYVEAVLPKKYGVRKPFYFIFQPSEWGFGRKSAQESITREGQSRPNNGKPGFEDETSGNEAGVEIVKLRKEFGNDKVAVNDISVNIFKGQIFCLLGENGAGKTTTMSMLTGLFSPTSGTAFINGLDIRTDMNTIRQNLGLCPQHNMLFDKMTVLEHLKFFGMLRGLSSKKAEAEAINLLEVLQIPEKKNTLAMSLSGGQKRRLSLGCSIIGGSKVVFLDEPTSGMDPEARRAIWDILLRIRHDCTIVLTTHYLEEADVLGDRIAIMASGVLQCCGSPNYLKRFYGAGYNLSMTVQGWAKRELILNTVRNHIADAYFKVSHSNSETELSIVLPSESNTSASFPALFSELTQRQKDLGIDEIGVGWTTMDEVFVKVEELSHTQDENGNENIDYQNSMDDGSKLEKAQGLKLLVSQFYGLLMKKIVWTIRRKRLVMFQMLIPVLLTIAAVAISRAMYSTDSRTPPLKFTLSAYNKPVTLFASSSGTGNAYAATVGSSAKRIDSGYNNNVSAALLAVGRSDISYFRERHIIAGEINSTHMKAMYSTIARHSSPLSMNIMTNTMLREAKGSEYKVETINHPFRNQIYDLLEPAKENPEFTTIISFIFGVLVPIGMALLVGSFIIAPTDERLCKGKQLQIMTGVNPMLYWGSMYICDYLLMLITICLMTACLPIFESHKTFTNNGGAGVLFLIMAVYGIATLSFTYIFSTFVGSVAGGFTLVTIIHLVTGIGLGVGSTVIDTVSPGETAAGVINIIGRLFPTFGVTRGAIQYAKVSSSNSRCYALTEEALTVLCSPSFDPSSYYFGYMGITQDCCENCHELGPGDCFEPEPYFEWSRPVYIERGMFLIKVNVPGITQDLVWLVLIAIVYLVILVMVEYDIFKMIWESILKQKAADFQRTVNDVDVIEESNRISNLVTQGRTNEEALAVHNLCKSYGVFSAVSSLSFGVHHGECFGLLGVNGAGKTTTFRMLTGDENRSNGNSYIDNLSLVHGRKQFLANLGYCPQFDGIVGVLTGREMLSLFARLRGIPSHCVQKETEKWLKRTGLIKSGNVHCQKYSGGMKRRLSAAMALIGDPQVILLDEPTSGVDPVARRQFWKIIASVKNSGQAIILTSHSMEECEALCSRLGIMVNGEMQCLGGVQHLKNKFAQGYSLTIKLKQEHYQNNEMTGRIANAVLYTFNPCSLKDHHQTTMKFQIHSQFRRWEDLYRTMEEIKRNNQECIEEYAITETTLEEVFLSFARTQYVEERVITGGNFLQRIFS